MEDLRKDIGGIKIDIAEIKVDLKYHIRRTETNEQAIEILKTALYKFQGAVILIGIILTIVSIWAKLRP